MIIDIDDEFRIRRYNSMNWVIERHQEVERRVDLKPTGETYWKWDHNDRNYYGSVKAALKALPDLVALSPSVESLTALNARLDRLSERIEELGRIDD